MHLPRNKQPREGTSTLPETNKILKIQIEDTHQQRETILINVHRPRETKNPTGHRQPASMFPNVLSTDIKPQKQN